MDVVQAQEAQEAQARTAQVLGVLADWGSAKGRQEAAGEAVVQEVQEHPSHLPPDRAALARWARPLTARGTSTWSSGTPKTLMNGEFPGKQRSLKTACEEMRNFFAAGSQKRHAFVPSG